ncbi:hypothetical protein TNCV_3115821 [Trichonephila clavipes]|nr:hypothetical protein TNCV_3115821 [Trichonephila clavipes]
MTDYYFHPKNTQVIVNLYALRNYVRQLVRGGRTKSSATSRKIRGRDKSLNRRLCLICFAAEFRAIMGHEINTRTPSRGSAQCGMMSQQPVPCFRLKS